MPGKFRLVSVSLMAVLVVVACCSMLSMEVSANGPVVSLTSRHVSGSSSNLGTITFATTTYTLPSTISPGYGTFDIRFNPASGTYFIRWELEFPPGPGPKLSFIHDPNAQTTKLHLDDTVTLRAIYGGTPAVGGVIMSANIATILASYLAMIGLVATAAVAIKKRRN